jgi:PAS domain-containing protein
VLDGTAVNAHSEAEARLRRRDGEYRWFLFRANPLRDEAGHVIKWYGVNTDIEDRKRAEDHLRRSEAFLAEGQRLSQTGSFFWRTDTDQIVFSDELRRIFDFTSSDVLTLPLIASRVHPTDLPLVQAKNRNIALRNGFQRQRAQALNIVGKRIGKRGVPDVAHGCGIAQCGACAPLTDASEIE